MMSLLLVALLSASSPSRPLSTDCRLLAPDRAEMMPANRVYTGRRDRLVRVTGDRFVDLRYDAYAGIVGITVLEMPHAPWSFGERIIEKEQILRLDSRSSPGGVIVHSLKPEARLECGPR